MANNWASDAPISMPQPNEHAVMVPMFGFGYNQYGITHDINAVDYMNFRRPSKAPDVGPGETVHDDALLDEEGSFL